MTIDYAHPRAGHGYRWPLATHPGGVGEEAKVAEALAQEIKRGQSQQRAADIFGPMWDKTDALFQSMGHAPPPRPMSGPMSVGGPSMAFPAAPTGNVGDTSEQPADGPAGDPGESDDPQGIVEHANPAAMAPVDVRTMQAPQGLSAPNQDELVSIADALKRESGMQNGALTYSHGKLAEQPWFNKHVQGSRLESQMTPEQSKALGVMGQMPGIQHVGERQNPAGWNSYQAYMNAPERVQAREEAGKARLKRVQDEGAFRQAQIDNSPARQRAMRQAAFNANPQLATMQALRDIGGGGGGGFGPAQAFAMANAGMGEFVPALANAAVAQAQHADANRLAQGQLDLQGRIVGMSEDAANAGKPKDFSTRKPFEQAVIARQFKERYNDSRDIFGRNQMNSHQAKQEALLHNMSPAQLVEIAKQAERGTLPVAEPQAPTRSDPGTATDLYLLDVLKKLGSRLPFMPLVKSGA